MKVKLKGNEIQIRKEKDGTYLIFQAEGDYDELIAKKNKWRAK